jgi:hypothetical protein
LKTTLRGVKNMKKINLENITKGSEKYEKLKLENITKGRVLHTK